MQPRFERPASVAQATRLLAARPWAVLAGGTALYPAHVARPIALPVLDLGGIAELRGIRRAGASWTIGATTTWSDVARAELPPLFAALQAGAREGARRPARAAAALRGAAGGGARGRRRADPEHRDCRGQPLQRVACRRRHP